MSEVVLASPRLPGLLDRRGWRTLDRADVVVVRGEPAGWAPALDDAGVRWRAEDGVPAAPGEIVLDVSGRGRAPGEPLGAHLLDLVAVMDRLRSPGGCPWDAEQTHATLAPYAIEEAHEVVEAIEEGTPADLVEELGDLLLQVAFHARVAQEATGEGRFDVDDVADRVVAKLVARHPHVFADPAPAGTRPAATAADVQGGWEARKRVEKGRASAFDGIPVALPALARATKVARRASGAGLAAEVAEDDGLGGDLLGSVLEALRQDASADPEAALRAATRAMEARLRALEPR
ncbi:MazG nucleotide pyrophosphohydrolase domain-containing protein [Pseudokineococcus basanitobsidens]|uniref:MazG nucleotide pyrophosphohydrolase domain-containing protein n=1 Tax=Pseudokineococcus basanitobsidens TaxID=1926649 RepID=A0ABU8RMW4_9ACTN